MLLPLRPISRLWSNRQLLLKRAIRWRLFWVSRGEYRAAAVRYRQVIAQQPDAVRAYNNLACTLALQGREPEALRVYLEAIRRQPDWAVPYENLGRVLEARQPAAAAAAYRQAIALQPDLLSAHCALGLLLFQQKQIAAAVESLTRLLTLDPGPYFGPCYPRRSAAIPG